MASNVKLCVISLIARPSAQRGPRTRRGNEAFALRYHSVLGASPSAVRYGPSSLLGRDLLGAIKT